MPRLAHFFEGVHSLPAGAFPGCHARRVPRSTDTSTSNPTRIRLTGWPDYVDAFHQLFSASVRRPPAKCDPGGQSRSVAASTRRIYFVSPRPRSSDAAAHCPGFWLQLRGPCGTPSDERSFVTALEEACGVPIARIPSAGFMQVAPSERLVHRIAHGRRLDCQAHAGMRAMREAGAGRLLTGHWGDQVLFDSDYLLDLLRPAGGACCSNICAAGESPRPESRRGSVARSPPATCRRGSRLHSAAWRSRQGAPWRAPWFTPRFRRVLRDRATCARLHETSGTSHAAAITVRAGWAITSTAWSGTIARRQPRLDIAFPYLDVRCSSS